MDTNQLYRVTAGNVVAVEDVPAEYDTNDVLYVIASSTDCALKAAELYEHDMLEIGNVMYRGQLIVAANMTRS